MNMKRNTLALALLTSIFSAHATQECGVSAVNVCTNAAYPSGISYYGFSVTSITLNNLVMEVQTNGVHAGPSSVAPGVANTTLAATDFNLINTTSPGLLGRGIMSSNRGPAITTVTNGEVKTVGGLDGSGNSAIAILAETLGPSTGNALAQVNGTKVSTTGPSAIGILAVTGFLGAVTGGGARVEASGITLSTTGTNAQGLYALGVTANTAPIDIIFTSGTVETQGTNSTAVQAVTQGGPITVDIQAAAQATANGVGANGVVASGPASANVTINNAGKIKSAQADGINISAALKGGVITSSGDISGATAAVRGSPAADTFTASGGAIDGVTLMGDGNDIVTLTGSVNVSAAPQFDGGAGADTLNIDGISLSGFTAAANNPALGNNLTLWETVDVKNAGTLKLTGNLFDAANTGVLKLSDAASTLDLQNAATAISTVNGDFDSVGVLKIDTVVGDSTSASDVLHTTGSTTGATVIQINNLGGLGALTTDNGILVVQVDGNSDGTFTLPGGSLVVGQYAYTLQKVGNNWYLQSRAAVGTVTVSKQVTVPAGASAFSGSIPFTLNCTTPSFSQAGTIVVSANQGTSSPITVAVGSACSVTEGTLPAAPAGMEWATPVYVQPRAIVDGQVTTATITNTLKKIAVVDGTPAPVPSLNQWALVLLSMALAGVGLFRTRVR